MNDRHNSLDYKNISLMLTGEISSACIKRNNLIQPAKHTSVSFMDNMEDDDEKFILDLKKNIDKSSITQNKENYNIKNLQNKSYSLKTKSAFSEEDQNLIKRFKRSIDESKALCITSQKPENINYFNNHNLSPNSTDVQGTSREHSEEVLKTFLRPQDVLRTFSGDLVLSGSFPTNTTLFTPIAFNNIDRNFRNKANRFFFHITSNMQKNQQVITPASKVFAETEIEEMIYYEMKYLTQPQKIN